MEVEKIESVIGKTFLKKKSYLGEKEKEMVYAVQECSLEEISGTQYVLVFFSAGWCPPCQQFQQLLKDFYHEVNIDGKVVEIIYVSNDKSEAEFKESYAKMPWLTYKWESGEHQRLKNKYDVTGIPLCFVLDSNTGFLVSKKGRKDICDLSVSCLQTWAEELPDEMAKDAKMREGFAAVETMRKEQEAEEKKKLDAEEKDE